MLMTGLIFVNGRDANGCGMCEECSCAFRGEACENPACDANPSVPEAHKAARRERYEAEAARNAQWAADREVRRRAGGW